MKTLPLKLFFLILFSVSNILNAQDVTTIQANNSDISDNLDLEAVASIFGESKDLEDFEKRLNDPSIQISNLDLNGDNEVDYLRVVETSEKNVHTIAIEAVIGKDLYQEVATIDVIKDSKNATQVQVVGNVDMYGPNYCVTPHYPVVPVFFSFFWMATYHPWHSPWYWGYHPPYFRPWHPYPPYRYHSNINVHINVNNRYTHNNVRINNNNININSNNRNNAYFKNNPDKSFNKRNPGVSNRNELNTNRKTKATKVAKDKGINNKADLNTAKKNYKSSGRPVTQNNKSTSKPTTKPSTTKPSTKPTTRPSTTKPTTKPSTKPTSKPTTKPSTSRPSTHQSSKPSSYNKSSHRSTPSRASTPRRSYRR